MKEKLYPCLCCGKLTKSGACEKLWLAFTKAYSEPLDDNEYEDLK